MKTAAAFLLSLIVTAHAAETPSQQIDRLVESALTEQGLKPNAPASDPEFLRRTYLSIAGRIPTADEARAFLDSAEKNKRSKLIDQLLDSDGYVSHSFNYWADILRAQSRLQGIRGDAGDPYILHIKNALRENTPYDEFVHGLLTSSGDTWDKNAGASGFYRRDKGMPLDHMALTMQVFMGTQMACAQCHDHPFDDWTQKQFYQMAAFTSMPQPGRRNSGMIARMGISTSEKDKALRRLLPVVRNGEDPNGRFVALYLRNVIGNGVPDAGVGAVRLPSDYQYEDEKPGALITAETVLGQKAAYSPRAAFGKKDAPNSREVFADWMTSPENPRFTKVIANRLWKRVMGAGVIEPVDDFRANTTASNPELMAFLEKQMVALNYDLKAFQRMLYNTRTYQRKAHTDDVDFAKAYYFPGPLMQRMSAEQIWDSLLTLRNEDVDAFKNPHSDGPYEAYKKLDAMSADEIVAFVNDVLADIKGTRANPGNIYTAVNRKLGVTDNYSRRNSAMMAMTSKLSGEQRALFAKHGGEMRDLFAQARQARENGDMRKFRELSSKSMELRRKIGITPEMMREAQQANRRQGGQRNRNAAQFVRASELPSPAPPGHFLRQFGSSDRESIENASREATTPQALQLLNGVIDRALLNDQSCRLLKELKSLDSSARLDHIFLAIYSRKPTEQERPLFDSYSEKDIIWAALNSHEFLFIR